MATNSVNFFQPGTDQAIDMRQVQRQRELADMLLRQGQTPQQGQMVSGHYVAPGKGAYVAQLANALFGNLASRRADEQEREMGQRIKAGRERESNDFLAALSGTPGQPGRDIQPLTPNDDEGNPMPVARTDAIPGMAADPNKALGIGMRSDNPMLQALAAKLMEQKMQDSAFESFANGGAPSGSGAAPAGIPGMAGGAPEMSGAPQGGGNKFLGEGFGQVPTGIAKLAFRKDPAELAKMVMDARKPVALREGDFIAPNGAGGVQSLYTQPKLEPGMQPVRAPTGAVTGAEMIPGYDRGVASIAGAKAGATQGAESANTMVTVNTPDGPRMVTRAQAVQMAGGAGGNVPGTPAVAGETLGQRNNNPGNLRPVGASTGFQQFDTPEAGLAALDQNLQAYGKRGINSIEGVINRWAPSNENNTSAYVASVAKRLGLDPKAPIDLGNPYVRQALGTAIMLHENGSGILTGGARGAGAGRGGQGIPLQSEAAKEYDTARAKDFAKTAADLQDRARSAGGTLRNLDTLEQLYRDPNVAKGGMAESISGLKNIGASLGVETKGLGTEQAIEAITNKMALDARSTAEGGGMPGAMSDADRNFLKAQQPGLSKTPEGRAVIIANARKVAQRQQQIAQMANEYERANGRLDAGFDRAVADFAAQNQMFADQKASASTAPAAPDFKALAAQELARRRAKNGG